MRLRKTFLILRFRTLLATNLIDTFGLWFTLTFFCVTLFERWCRENDRMFMNPTPRVVVGVKKPKHVISGSWSRSVRK